MPKNNKSYTNLKKIIIINAKLFKAQTAHKINLKIQL